MTTVDFSISTDTGERLLTFHDGMSGTATDLLHSAFQLAQAGEMTPTRFNVAEMESEVTGTVLRELLGSVTFDAAEDDPTEEDVAGVLNSIDASASYRISGLEV